MHPAELSLLRKVMFLLWRHASNTDGYLGGYGQQVWGKVNVKKGAVRKG